MRAIKLFFDYKLFLKQCRNNAEVSKGVAALKCCEKIPKGDFALGLFLFITLH
jgi:hypothetical protein